MQKAQFFPYSWHVDESQEEFTCIRIYGLNKKNENVCVRVDDFTPYVYIELPTRVRWNATKAQILGDKLDSLLGRQKPVKKALTWKKKLYGAHIDPDTGESANKTWAELQVGMVVCLSKDQAVPADIVMLHSSHDQGTSYVTTAGLDGETNLKLRKTVRT